MYDDFDPRHAGKGCDGTGIMSYGSYDYKEWSKCSEYDWVHHFSSNNWGSSCLEDISGNKDYRTVSYHSTMNKLNLS